MVTNEGKREWCKPHGNIHCSECDRENALKAARARIEELEGLVRRQATTSYALDEEQSQKARVWIDAHNEAKHKNCHGGAIGGRYTFCFTSTTIGVVIVVRCACGEEIDVSDYDSW